MGANIAAKIEIGYLLSPWLSPEMEYHLGQSKMNPVYVLELYLNPISVAYPICAIAAQVISSLHVSTNILYEFIIYHMDAKFSLGAHSGDRTTEPSPFPYHNTMLHPLFITFKFVGECKFIKNLRLIHKVASLKLL
jgi:hypothetical protein